MTELIFKNKINKRQLESIVDFLRSRGIEAEVKMTAASRKKNTQTLFSESFGMWANRDINVKQIRQNARLKRTKSYDDGTL